MLNAIIIDDEPLNVVNLRRLLENHCPDVRIVATASSADEGLGVIAQHDPELVFLDILMPVKTGFDMLKEISGHGFELIFVTAFDQNGIQAVKFAAIDYLMKPVDIDELKAAVAKASARVSQRRQNMQLEYLVEILKQGREKDDHRIALPSAKETRFVYTRDITRCESSNSYTTFFMKDGEKIIVSVSLYEYEEMLAPYGFLRSHQSHLVNKRFVKSLVRDSGGYLLMLDGSQVPVSRQKREEVKRML